MTEQVVIDVFGPLADDAHRARIHATHLYCEGPRDPDLETRLAHARWQFLEGLNRAAGENTALVLKHGGRK